MTDRQIALQIVANDLASATVQRVNANVQQFTQTANRAGSETMRLGAGFRQAEVAVQHLAREVLGLNPHVAKLAEVFLSMGVGGAVVTGVAAGIAAIGFAYDKLTENARKAKEEMQKTIDKAIELSKLGSVKTAESVAPLEKRLAEINRLLAENVTTVNRMGPAFGLSAKELQKLQVEAAKLTISIKALRSGGPVGPGSTGGAVVLPDLEVTSDFLKEERKKLMDRVLRQVEEQFQPPPPLPIRRTSDTERVSEGDLPDWKSATKEALSFKGVMDLIAASTLPVAEGLAAINDSLLGSIPGFGQVAKAAQKAVQVVAKVEGAIAIAKGAVKIAESIWPFQPQGIVSGTKMIVEGAKLSALGGGSGSASSASGGGAGSAATYNASNQEIAKRRDRVTVILPPIIPTTDTGVQDWLAQVIREAAGRDADFQVGVA